MPNNSEPQHITDEDIKKLVKSLKTEFPILLSNMMGKDIRRELKINSEEELRQQLKNFFKEFEELDRMECQPITLKEKISIFKKFIRKAFVGEIPENQDVIDWIIFKLKSSFQIPSDMSYPENTNYLKYIATLKKLSQQEYEKGRVGLVDAFLKEFKKSEDSHIVAQSIFRSLGYYKYLQKEFKYVQKPQVEKYIQIYGELSGDYEKHLRIIVGLLDILNEGERPDYQKIKKRNLSNNMEKVEKEKDYKILVMGINRAIRNSIAHNSYIFDIFKKQIKFVDRRKEITLSYSEFVNQTRELSALVWALFQLHTIFLYYNYLRIKDAFDYVMRQS